MGLKYTKTWENTKQNPENEKENKKGMSCTTRTMTEILKNQGFGKA